MRTYKQRLSLSRVWPAFTIWSAFMRMRQFIEEKGSHQSHFAWHCYLWGFQRWIFPNLFLLGGELSGDQSDSHLSPSCYAAPLPRLTASRPKSNSCTSCSLRPRTCPLWCRQRIVDKFIACRIFTPLWLNPVSWSTFNEWHNKMITYKLLFYEKLNALWTLVESWKWQLRSWMKFYHQLLNASQTSNDANGLPR